MISVSSKAAEKIREFMNQQHHSELFLHVALVQTHCMGGKGFAYRLAFEQQLQDGQKRFESNGVRMAVDNSATSRLAGTNIDYVETIESQGFVIKNPNAIMKCPCGHHDIFAVG